MFLCFLVCSHALSIKDSAEGLIVENPGIFKARFDNSGDLLSYHIFSKNWERAMIEENPLSEKDQKSLSSFSGIRFGFISRKFPDLELSRPQVRETSKALEIVFASGIKDISSIAHGLEIQKIWTFRKDYFVSLRIEIRNQSSKSIALWPSSDIEKTLSLIFGVQGEVQYFAEYFCGPSSEVNGHEVTEELKNLPVSGWQFAGFRDQFFLAGLMDVSSHKLYAAMNKLAVDKDFPEKVPGLYTSLIPFDAEELTPGSSRGSSFEFYLGPKSDVMVGSSFEPAFNKYGKYLGVIEKGMFQILSGLFRLTGSYGLSILLLTLIIKLILFPINIKQTRSMAKMQEIQPLIKEIQEKYAEDKQRQSQEMMKIYQENQVNPLGGCLPMFLQLPVFLSLYYTVGGSVEMYGEKFLWLTDLANRDPFDILPGIFVLSFILSQRKMSIDPNQKALMFFMPLLFFVMMRNLAAGVMLYIVGQSLFTNIEQLIIKKGKSEPVPEVSRTDEKKGKKNRKS